MENLAAACAPCNSGKRAETLAPPTERQIALVPYEPRKDRRVPLQVYLEPDLAERLQTVRQRLGVPVTEIIRRLIDNGLPALETASPAPGLEHTARLVSHS